MDIISGTRQPKHSFIPKSYPRFEFTIPDFHSMSLSAPEVDGALPEGMLSKLPQDAASKWLTMRREALVEVRRDSHDSKPFMVARSRLMKSQNNTKTDYDYALDYVMQLYDRTKPIEQHLQETPTLRLQAWFEEGPIPSGGTFSYGQGRYFDIDPRSWSQVWSYADRILLTTNKS